MSKGMTKEELRAPDAFISVTERAMNWIYERRQIALLAFVVVFVGSLVYLGVDQFNQYQNKKVAEIVYKAEKPLRSYLISLVGTKDKAATIDETQFKPLFEEWQKAIDAHPSSRASLISFMNMTQLLREKGQLDTVKSMTEQLKPSLSKSDFLWALWRFQKAGIFVETGETDKAISSLQEITKEKDANWLHGEALLRMGMIYEKTNKDLAIQTYEKILSEHGQTSAAPTARRLLDQIKQKNG